LIYFFGGYQKKTGEYYNDLFYYDIERKRWDNIAQVGDCPSNRTDHTLSLYDGSLYVFGGYDGKARFGDLYKCSLKSSKYKWRLIEGDGVGPLNRFGHTAVVFDNSLYIFGGWNGHYTMDDLF
jgi:N-acetylneuraminic acid mutarotase